MLRDGVIEHSKSPWLSPVVLVRKKDGGIRFCIDFRNLNQITTADAFPLPNMTELLDSLKQTKYFSVLDAKSAYWSIHVAPEDRCKTAFTDGHQLFQWVRMPFGLKTAPNTFQRTLSIVLSPVLGNHCLCYLDDIIIYSNTFQEHIEHLSSVLTLLDKAGLKLNFKKCQLARPEIKFLGFLVSAAGLSPDPEKVEAVTRMPSPKNVQETRRYLGCVGFFRRHIKDFADIAAPLTDVTKKNRPFVWGEAQENAFQELKRRLKSAPVLVRPDFSKSFQIHTDASKLAVAGCLMQTDDNDNLHPVAYFSRKLRGAESRYSAINLEALAVVESVRAFNPYVYGRHFSIFTDHAPLIHVFKRRTKCPRMSRWSIELAEYNYTIYYKQGKSNHVPDTLSRSVAAVDLENVDPQDFRELQMKDPQWKAVIEYLEGNDVPKRKLSAPIHEFEMENGVLYHLRHTDDKILHRGKG